MLDISVEKLTVFSAISQVVVVKFKIHIKKNLFRLSVIDFISEKYFSKMLSPDLKCRVRFSKHKNTHEYTILHNIIMCLKAQLLLAVEHIEKRTISFDTSREMMAAHRTTHAPPPVHLFSCSM